MESVVTKQLGSGAQQAAMQLRLFKLIYLREIAAKYVDNLGEFDKLLGILKTKNAGEIISLGSTFFWNNLSRCYDCLSREDYKLLPSRVNYTVQTGIDCFFKWIPENISFEIQGDDAGELILPTKFIRIPISGQSIVITKTSGNSFVAVQNNVPVVFDIDNIPSGNRIESFAIPKFEQATLIMVNSPCLFDKEYSKRVAFPERSKCEFLAKLIGKSLELIEAADPQLSIRFNPFVKWYVPIDAPDELTHNSLSVKYLSGTIFLSIAYSDFRLAEAMVHELGHNELYLLQETESLFEVDPGDILYSPFREDPRPLNGLIHALYVFTSVVNFIREVEKIESLADYLLSYRHRRKEVLQQVRLGFYQVPAERIKPLGHELLEWISNSLESHEMELGELENPLPAKLEVHLKNWRNSYPEYADRIKLPLGHLAEA